jgi:hypothetical protein
MIPLILAPVFLFASDWMIQQRVLFGTLQAISMFFAAQMLINYRSIFANVTWRNPDGASEFWPLLHLQNGIPNCIANQPEIGLIACWIIASLLFAFCLYPRQKEYILETT